MRTKRFITVLVVLVSATPSRAPTPPTSDDLINGATGILRGWGILPSDEVDTDFIMDAYKKALNELTKTSSWPCVKGLFQEVSSSENMKMWEGRLQDVQHNIRLEVNNIKQDQGNTVAEVGFKFPDMILDYQFQYNSTVMLVSYSKTGSVKFKVGGANVEVNVKLPNSKEKIGKLDKKNCYNNISPTGITTKASSHFQVLDVKYPSTTGFNYSKSSMIAVFQKLKKDIVVNMSFNLERQVANAVTKIIWSCLDQAAVQKWPPAKQGEDCASTDYRTATKYGHS